MNYEYQDIFVLQANKNNDTIPSYSFILPELSCVEALSLRLIHSGPHIIHQISSQNLGKNEEKLLAISCMELA